MTLKSHLTGCHQKGQFKDNIIHKRHVLQQALNLKIHWSSSKKRLNQVFNLAQSAGEFYQGLIIAAFSFERGKWDCPRNGFKVWGYKCFDSEFGDWQQREHSTQPLLGIRPSASNYHGNARKLVSDQGNHSTIITLQKLPTALRASCITWTYETNQFLSLPRLAGKMPRWTWIDSNNSFRIGKRPYT